MNKILLSALSCILLLLCAAAACPGTIADSYAFEVHLDVNRTAEAGSGLAEIKLGDLGSTYGVSGSPRVYYSHADNLALIIYDNAVRFQIPASSASDQDYVPIVQSVNWTDSVGKELSYLTKRQLVSLSDEDIKDIVGFAEAGVAGNQWVQIRNGSAEVNGVRGCGNGFPLVVKSWKTGVYKTVVAVHYVTVEKDSLSPVAVISIFALIILVAVFLLGKKFYKKE